jgi:hypothetical protein|tara:strand:+ start:1252 stop:1374 length:123 start_codon:yes stop_codon:yes gene_type:complete
MVEVVLTPKQKIVTPKNDNFRLYAHFVIPQIFFKATLGFS